MLLRGTVSTFLTNVALESPDGRLSIIGLQRQHRSMAHVQDEDGLVEDHEKNPVRAAIAVTIE